MSERAGFSTNMEAGQEPEVLGWVATAVPEERYTNLSEKDRIEAEIGEENVNIDGTLKSPREEDQATLEHKERQARAAYIALYRQVYPGRTKDKGNKDKTNQQVMGLPSPSRAETLASKDKRTLRLLYEIIQAIRRQSKQEYPWWRDEPDINQQTRDLLEIGYRQPTQGDYDDPNLRATPDYLRTEHYLMAKSPFVAVGAEGDIRGKKVKVLAINYKTGRVTIDCGEGDKREVPASDLLDRVKAWGKANKIS